MKFLTFILVLIAIATATGAKANNSSPFIGKTYLIDFGSDLQGVVTFTSDSTMIYGDQGEKGSQVAIEIACLMEGVYSVKWTVEMRKPWNVQQTFNFTNGKVRSDMRSGGRSASMEGRLEKLK